MSDELRYRLIDEPKPSPLSRFALPPLLVFIAANLFLPWGWLLFVYNAFALNGPARNREIALSAAAIGGYFAALVGIGVLLKAEFLPEWSGSYIFVFCIGACLVLIAKAYLSQERVSQLRKYLSGRG